MSPAPARFGPPLDVRPVLPAERTALRGLLNGLGEADWSRRTTPGWTVFDTAAHLAGGDLVRLSRTRDQHVALEPDVGETLPELIDRLNEEWVAAARRFSPRVIVELLETFGPRVVAAFAGLELTDPGAPVSWAGTGPAPVWLDMAREYVERWVHQQQIRLAVEEPLLDEPKFLKPVVETCMRALPMALASSGRPEGTAVVVTVRGDAGGTWVVQRGPEHWGLVPAARSPDAAAEVEVAPTTLWQVAARMIEPDAALEAAKVKGDVDLAAAVLSLLVVTRAP